MTFPTAENRKKLESLFIRLEFNFVTLSSLNDWQIHAPKCIQKKKNMNNMHNVRESSGNAQKLTRIGPNIRTANSQNDRAKSQNGNACT